MATTGHVYRDTWHGGRRCYCCNLTDAEMSAQQAGTFSVGQVVVNRATGATGTVVKVFGACEYLTVEYDVTGARMGGKPADFAAVA